MDKLILTTPEELKRLIERSVQDAMRDYSASGQAKENRSGNPLYLTITEAAAYLNLAKQTLYGFTSSRAIPFIKRAKRLLFLKSDLDEWLAQGRKPSADQLKTAVSNGNSRTGRRS